MTLNVLGIHVVGELPTCTGGNDYVTEIISTVSTFTCPHSMINNVPLKRGMETMQENTARYNVKV